MEKTKKDELTTKDDDSKVGSKCIWLRIALFVIAIIIAAVSFGFGISQCTNQYKITTGLYDFNFSDDLNDESYYELNKRLNLVYYLDDSNNTSANKKYQTIKDFVLTKAKYFFDLYYSFEDHDLKGMNYINAHPNEDIQIDELLYNSLKDAYSKSNSNYSIFGGLLFTYYQSCFTYFKKNNDALNNSLIANDLNTIKEIYQDIDNNFSLTFKDNNTINFSYSSKVSSFLTSIEDQSQEVRILDFNVLFNSYFLDYMKSQMKENNYLKGYFYTPNGEMTFIGNLFTGDNEINIYDIQDKDKITPIGIIKNRGECNVSSFRTFSLNDTDTSYFNSFSYNDKTYTRNLLLSLDTCECNETIDTSFMISSNLSLVDLTYNHFNAIWALSENNSDAYKNEDIIAGYVKKGDDDQIYLNSNAKECYYDYTISDEEIISYKKIVL